jgi:hypothetical protein
MGAAGGPAAGSLSGYRPQAGWGITHRCWIGAQECSISNRGACRACVRRGLMVGAVVANSLISGVYGSGTVRAVRPAWSARGGGLGDAQGWRSAMVPPATVDTVEISPAARQAALVAEQSEAGGGHDSSAASSVESIEPDRVEVSRAFRAELSPEERAQVGELEERDREVRAHEEAHRQAGGQYVRGGPSFKYEVGPDGRRYAVDGEVQIDTTPVRGDPEATIQKMKQVRQAALAPADPSAQDRRVAAQAMAAERQARAELMRQHSEERRAGGDSGESTATVDRVSDATLSETVSVMGGESNAGPRAGIETVADRFAAFISPGQQLDIAA